MSQAWQSALYVGETGQFTVDWTDECNAASDTLTGTPTVKFIDSSGVEQTTLYGLTVSSVTLSSDSKKVTFLITNSDWATNKANAKTNSPHLLVMQVSLSSSTQVLRRVLLLEVSERGSELTVETGSVVAGANTWISLEDATEYHLRLGNTDWTGTPAEMARALRRGAQYINATYRNRVKGTKTDAAQTMIFPRTNLEDEDGNSIDSDVIPQGVKDAQCEAARAVPSSQEIEFGAWVKSVRAGSAGVEFAQPLEVSSILDLVEGLMRPYLHPGGRFWRA